MASSAAFLTTFLDLLICPGCGNALSGLPPKRLPRGRTAALASADVIPYYGASLQKVGRPAKQKQISPKAEVVDGVAGMTRGTREQLEGKESGRRDQAMYLGEGRKWRVEEENPRWSEAVSQPALDPSKQKTNGTLFSKGAASLWHSEEGKPGAQQSPSLSSRYLRVAMYLREQGLVLNRAIHRFVGEQSLAEVQALLATLRGVGCEQAQAVSMIQR